MTREEGNSTLMTKSQGEYHGTLTPMGSAAE